MPEGKNLREAQRLEEMYGLPVEQALAAMNMADTEFQAGVAPYLSEGSEIDPEAMSLVGVDPSQYMDLPMGVYRPSSIFSERGVSSRRIDNPMQNEYFPVESGGIAIFGADNANPQIISHEYRHKLGLDKPEGEFFPSFDDREKINRLKDLLASRTDKDFESASERVGGLDGIESLMEQEGAVIGPAFTANVPRGTSEEGIGELMNNNRPRSADRETSRADAATAALMRQAGLPVASERDAADLEPEILDQLNAIMGRSTEE